MAIVNNKGLYPKIEINVIKTDSFALGPNLDLIGIRVFGSGKILICAVNI